MTSSEAAVARLASAAAATRWDDAPPMVRDRVVDLVADVVAAAALGSNRTELRNLAATVAAGGACTVIGRADRYSAPTAALLNGAAVTADQYQDGHRRARGHPAAHVVPAVLALAEERDFTAAALLSAVLAGYETGVRVGCAMGGTPDGVHDIGTWGVVAAAVSTAHLLAAGDVPAVAAALESAASGILLTDTAPIFDGATGGVLLLGLAAQLGQSTGQGAAAGLQAQPGSLARHLGAHGGDHWDHAALTTGLGVAGWERWHVLDGYIKLHPTCAHLHGVNDAVQDLLASLPHGRLDASQVMSVEVRTFRAAAELADPAPVGELAARFSIPATVALALVHGRLDELTVTDATCRDPGTRALATRVRVVADPLLEQGYPAGRPAQVTVTLSDGRVLAAAATRPRGDADEVSRSVLHAKAARLLRHRFGSVGDELLETVLALGDGLRPTVLGAALRRAGE